MKWFKHETNAHADAKLKKLRMRYGLEGVGLYWYCLELIGQSVEPHNLTFELEHDAEIIASDVNIHIDRVQEMMRYMVDLRLFEQNGGIVTCLKMAVRADEYTQKAIRKQNESGECPDMLRITSRQAPDKVPSNRKKERIERPHLFDAFWDVWPKKVDKKKALAAFKKLNDADQQRAIADCGARYAGTEKRFIPNPATYLNGERWNDERVGHGGACDLPYGAGGI